MANFSAVIKQLLAERDRLNDAIAALEGVSSGASHRGRRSGRILSAAARARIAAAQRKRWATFRANKKKAA